MKNLPTKVVGRVVDNISSAADLLSLRAVNSAYDSLITPCAFRRVDVKNSVQSAKKCTSILGSPSLATLVEEVVFDQRDHDQLCFLPGYAEGVGVCEELEIAELGDALAETFCSLADFENLQSVTLNFWPSFRSQAGYEIQERPFRFADRQTVILHALRYGLKSSRIRSLTLNNVILTPTASYDFVSSLKTSPLNHVSISVVSTESELGTWSGLNTLAGSFSSLLPVPTVNLKSIVLRSPQGVYQSINTNLRSFDYPALEKLVLENIVLDPTPSLDDIAEFIVRHKATLRHLELRSYASYGPNKNRRWSTIWNQFDEELVSLTEIVVGSSTHQGNALLDWAREHIPHPSLPAARAELFQDDQQPYLLEFNDHVSRRTVSPI